MLSSSLLPISISAPLNVHILMKLYTNFFLELLCFIILQVFRDGGWSYCGSIWLLLPTLGEEILWLTSKAGLPSTNLDAWITMIYELILYYQFVDVMFLCSVQVASTACVSILERRTAPLQFFLEFPSFPCLGIFNNL